MIVKLTTCMLSLFTAMDIIISIKWGARVEKDLHVEVEKI